MDMVFLRDVQRADGSIRFKKGELRAWPRPTWADLAASLGVPVDELARPPAEVTGQLLNNVAPETAGPQRSSRRRVL